MADVLTSAQRHLNMSRVRSKDTDIEMQVRRRLHADGFRYRLNVNNLPGKPDIVLPKYKTIVFINGCFWHGHRGCPLFVMPKTNTEFWMQKIQRNISRDLLNYKILMDMNWNVIIVWECALRKSRSCETLSQLESLIRTNGIKDKCETPQLFSL